MTIQNSILVSTAVFSFLFFVFQLIYGSKLKWLRDPDPLALTFFYVTLQVVAGITYGLMWFCTYINFTAGAFLFFFVTIVSMVLGSTFWALFVNITQSLTRRPRYPHRQ
jgi:hypothetical protein